MVISAPSVDALELSSPSKPMVDALFFLRQKHHLNCKTTYTKYQVYFIYQVPRVFHIPNTRCISYTKYQVYFIYQVPGVFHIPSTRRISYTKYRAYFIYQVPGGFHIPISTRRISYTNKYQVYFIYQAPGAFHNLSILPLPICFYCLRSQENP